MQEPKFISQPLHIQLREALIQRIASGAWRPGAAIPNEIDIAREYGLSAGTVRKALDWMEQAHLVIRQQGRGTFVRDQSADELAQRYECLWDISGRRIVPSSADTGTTTVEADAYACDRLKLRPVHTIHCVTQLRLLAGVPFMHEQVALPADLFPSVPAGAYTVTGAASANQVLLGNAEERVTLADARGDVARKLGVSEGVPLLKLDRVIFSIDRRPAEWRVAHCRLGDVHYRAAIGATV